MEDPRKKADDILAKYGIKSPFPEEEKTATTSPQASGGVNSQANEKANAVLKKYGLTPSFGTPSHQIPDTTVAYTAPNSNKNTPAPSYTSPEKTEAENEIARLDKKIQRLDETLYFLNDGAMPLIPGWGRIYDNTQKKLEETKKEREALASKYSIDEFERKNAYIPEIVDNSILAGMSQFNRGVMSTLDFLTPTDFLDEKDPFSRLNDYFTRIDNENQSALWESVSDRSKATQFAADLNAETVSALPNAILALMSGGSSAVGTIASGAANTGLLSTAKTALTNMFKNPTYWTSAAQTLGPNYDEAIESGATEEQAAIAAIISTALESGIEVSGGLETLPKNLKGGGKKAVVQWVESMFDEGKEEVLQGIVSEIAEKAVYDRDKEVFSTTNEEAIIHPGRMAKEFGMGAAVGGILGGGQIGIASSINAVNNLANSRQLAQIDRQYQDYARPITETQESHRNAQHTSPDSAVRTGQQMMDRLGYGENGRRAFENIVEANSMSAEEANSMFHLPYLQGLSDMPVAATNFTSAIQQEAFNAGKMDRIMRMENPLANGNTEAYTDAINDSEGLTNEEKVYLRDGGQRAYGTDPGGEVRQLEEGPGRNQSGYEESRPRDRETASLTYGEEAVSDASLGIADAGHDKHLYLVKSGETTAMRAAKAEAKAHGLRTVFFAGDYLKLKAVDKAGKAYTFRARAMIVGDRMFVRVDDPMFTADQITRHEVAHKLIDTNQINPEDVRERINSTLNGKADQYAAMYAEAYAMSGTDMSADEIWVEVICDSYGDMNIFSGTMAEAAAAEYLEATKQAVAETRTEANKTRGPPAEAKTSRVVDRWFQRRFSGNVLEDEFVSLSIVEKAAIRSAIKSGYGTVTTDKRAGHVNTSAYCYIFDVARNGDVKVTDVIPHEELNIHNDEYSEEYENGEQSGNTDAGSQLEESRSGQGNGDNDISASSETRRGQADDSVAGKNSNTHDKRNMRQSEGDTEADEGDFRVSEDTYSPDYAYWRNAVKDEEAKPKYSRVVTTEAAINESMTMAQAKQMVQRAFVLGDIKNWYDGEYKNGDEWLRGAGAEEVAMYIDNEYSLQAAYLDKIQGILDGDFYTEDVLEAYLAGTLTGKVTPKNTGKIDLASSVAVADERFYAPKEIDNAKALYEIANTRLTNGNREKVTEARAKILLYAHNRGAAETLGLTDAELNKKLRSWSNYSAKAREISQRINSGVQESNRWTGLENMAYLSRSQVSADEVARMVKSVEGRGDDFQNNYVGRTMMALDTHIDWSWLNIKFDTYAGVNEASSSKCNGYYLDSKRLIHVKENAPNTVAHEMGHALDYQWAREIGLRGALTEAYRNTENVTGEARIWFDHFMEFKDSLVESSDIRSAYSGNIKETFARFVDKFVAWTEQLATGRNSTYETSFYNDKFTGSQFVRFARLLQEKAALDANGQTRNKVGDAEAHYSRVLDSVEALQKQNEKLRRQVEYWKGQTKPTEKTTLRQGDIDSLAKNLIKTYESTLKPDEIRSDLKELGEYILHNGDGKNELTWGEVKDRAVDIARDIVDSASVMVDDSEAKVAKEIRQQLHKYPLKFTDKADIPDYGYFERRNRKNFRISQNGTPVDIAYQQLQESYGEGYFPSEITHPADQLEHIADLLDSMDVIYENPFSSYKAEAIEYVSNDIIDGLIEARQTAPTFADKQAAKLAAQKSQDRQKLDEMRREKNQRISEIRKENSARTREALKKVRADRDAKVKALKEYYKEQSKNRVAWQRDSKARTRLLNIAKRLQNKKLPAASRALIDQYIGELDTVSKSMTGQTVRDLTALRDWYENERDNNPDFISDPRMEKSLARLSKKQIDSLTAAEVAELTNILLNIENEIRTQNKAIDSAERRSVWEMGFQVINDVENTKGSKGGLVDKLVLTETLSPIRQLRRLTGYVDNDPLYVIGNELADGQRKMFDFQRRAGDNFLKWTQDKAFVDEIAGKNAKEISIKGIGRNGETEVKITPAMRMSLYLHSLNDQNLRHVAGGGITVPDIKLYKKGKIAEAYARGTTIRLTPSEVRKICSRMSAKEKAFADAAHRYFNGMSQDSINEVSEKLKGYSLARVENYFPINTDTNFTKKDFEALKYDGTIEGMGFLKERINSASPIMLRDMNDVLKQSIDSTAKYVGLAIPVRNFNKVWGVNKASFNEKGERNGYESSVQRAIRERWGDEGYKYIENMMADLNNSRGRQDNWNKILNKIRSNYAGAVLTLNLSVAMKQAASYPTAAAVIGFKPLAKAMSNFGKVNLDLINKYTPLQWYRTQGFSTQELGDMAKRNASLPKVLNWVQGIDLLTTRKLWKAAEYYVRDTKAYERGSDEYYTAVADIYNQIIEETQPNYTTMQRPQLLRSENTLMQNLSMFKTQPFQNFNILYDAMGNLSAKKKAFDNTHSDEAKAALDTAKRRATWAVTSQFVQLAVFAGMTFAWNMLRGKNDKYDDEEGEMDIMSVLAGIGKDMLGGAASMVPFGSDVWEFLSSKLFGETYYGMDAVTVQAIGDAATSFGKLIDLVADTAKTLAQGEKLDWNDARLKADSYIDDMSKLLGIPYENVNNLFNALFLQSAKAIRGKYLGEYASLKWTASRTGDSGKYYDLLYKAYLDDNAAYEEMYADMIDSGFDADKIRNAMESRMKASQGVSYAEDLDRRYYSPEDQVRYDSAMGDVESSKLWDSATEAQQDKIENYAHDLIVGNDAGLAMQKKIDGGAAYGIDEADYLLYKLALEMCDKPTESGKRGTYTNDEVEAAIKMVPGLSGDAKSYLWEAQGRSEKSNPWN